MQLKPYQPAESVRPGGEVSSIMGVSAGSNTAQLIVFTARKYADQRIRPLVYNFTDEMKTSLWKGLDSKTPMTKLNSINAAGILPASHGGFDLSMRELEEYNGFLLIITTAATRFAPAEKIMYGGYFLEGVRSFGGHVNENARFIIAHSSRLTDNTGNKMNHRQNKLEITRDCVTVSRELEHYIRTPDRIFLNLPSDIDSLPSTHIMSGSVDASNILLDNLSNPVSIAKSTTIPTVMVNAIGDNIRDFVDNRETYRHGVESHSPMGDHYEHQENVHLSHLLRQRLPGLSSGGSIDVSSGLDESRSHTLGSLMYKFPDMHVFFTDQDDLEIANGEGIDQSYDGRQNQLCYLISYAIESVALNAGILSAHFTYHSHSPSPTLWTGRKIPTTITHGAQPISDNISPHQFAAMVKQFEINMEDYVFATVSAALGGSDYEAYVHYRHGQPTQVKLVLLDYQRTMQDGYYESYGYLSGLTAPTVANYDTVFNNRSSLQSFHEVIRDL